MPGKEDKGDAVLATEGGILTSNKTECFSYLPVNIIIIQFMKYIGIICDISSIILWYHYI